MTYNLYTIYDRLAEDAGPIFCAKNNAVALRQYNRLLDEYLSDQSHFKLYLLGIFNTESMQILVIAEPEEVQNEKAS